MSRRWVQGLSHSRGQGGRAAGEVWQLFLHPLTIPSGAEQARSGPSETPGGAS